MSTTSRPLTTAEYAESLREQINGLKSLANSFDAGSNSFAALQMAVSIRVLFHDTKNSKSLLGQMNKKSSLQMYNSCMIPDTAGNPLSYHPLSSITADGFYAMLDGVPHVQTPFTAWWDQVVFRDQNNATLSRKDLILIAANKAGGAHVDPDIDVRYADLADNLGYKATDGRDWITVRHAERAAIRQIAHEVVRTLDPTYRKTQENVRGHAIGGMVMNMIPATSRHDS